MYLAVLLLGYDIHTKILPHKAVVLRVHLWISYPLFGTKYTDAAVASATMMTSIAIPTVVSALIPRKASGANGEGGVRNAAAKR